MRDFVQKLRSGEYLHEWNGFSPFYAGCSYGNDKCLGGEFKFAHCYGSFHGVGDAEWWIKEEIDKLTDDEQSELLEILKRNKRVDDSITREVVTEIALDLGYTQYDLHYIYRLKNKNIIKLIECDKDDRIKVHSKILNEIDFDPVTLRRKM